LGYKSGLEGMVYRTSKSVAALAALVVGCSGLTQQASAGDKIQFSAPSPLLAIPRPEREVNDFSVADIRASLSTQHTANGNVGYAPSATIVVIPAKSRDRFGWNAPFEEDRDEDGGSGLNLFAPRKVSSPIRAAGVSNDKDSAFSKDRSWTETDRDLSQSGTDSLESEGIDGLRDSARLSGRFDDHSVSDWFKTLNSHGALAAERARQGDYRPVSQDTSTFFDRAYGAFSQGNPLGPTDPLHTSAYASGNAETDLTEGILGGQNDKKVLMQPSLPQAWEALPSAAHPVRPIVRQQAFSASSRAPNAPAMLAFPKRPGDLFQ
jgi:hypothetical protein